MKRPCLLICALALLFSACQPSQNARLVEDFNFDWYFTLGDDAAYASADYDHSAWRALHLPHDWAIEGEFSGDNPSTPGGGALPGGIGWYRKTFKTPAGVNVLGEVDLGAASAAASGVGLGAASAADLGRTVAVEFDGIFMNSTVWVNGHEVDTRPYGYSSFSYDITEYLAPEGCENVIAVRCDNADQPNSRWYAGCGIYRNTRLVTTSAVHVAYCGTYVTMPEVSASEAVVKVETVIEAPDSVSYSLKHSIYNAAGRKVASATGASSLEAPSVSIVVNKPQLWSPSSPYLYTLRTDVLVEGKVVDSYDTVFGIRYFEFTADRGLILNGEPLKLLGVCNHHDMGAIGSAVHVRAIQRQLEILKDMGCNSIRTSHNPPAPELLDLCDQMGFVVMDEGLDMWRRKKTQYDYARFFDDWHEKDIVDFLVRDRNHPSILIWSIGNEIMEQWNSDDGEDELSAEQANILMNFRASLPKEVSEGLNTNMAMAQHVAEIFKRVDPTRPLTSGCNEPEPYNNIFRADAVDIIGYNYHEFDYDSVAVWYPGKPFIATETTSATQSRGVYFQPSGEQHIAPLHWWETYDDPIHQLSAYDHSYVPWGAPHETAWLAVRDREFCSGIYVWTGFDYLGEPTPYSWPSRSSYFGIIDLCGFPKDAYYMYRSEWNTASPTLHLFPHWNWSEGDNIDVWAYYSMADEVELFLNGRSLGRRSKTADCLHCLWEAVPFEPGELTAISYRYGKAIAAHTRMTAGEPVALRLTADRTELSADGYDLAYVTIEAIDAAGNPVPTADNLLHFSVSGAGELFGVDNGNAAGGLSLKGSLMPLFSGKALAIIRTLRPCDAAGGSANGEITLSVNTNGLPEASITLLAR